MLMRQGLLKEVVQQTIVYAMIKEALEKDELEKKVELNDTSKATAQIKPNLVTTTTDKQPIQLNELPPHKLFGAFISHKKVQASTLLSLSAWF